MATVAELQAQLSTAQAARDSGKISQAQFDQFAVNQLKLIAQATHEENNATTSSVTSPVKTEEQTTPSTYYTRTQVQATISAEQADPDIMSKLPKGAVITAYNPETKEVQYRTAEQEQTYQQSSTFYTDIGHPEYAGKYAPPVLPAGTKVADVKEVTTEVNGVPTTSLAFTVEQTNPQAPVSSEPKFQMPFANGNLPVSNPLGGPVLATTPEGRTAALVVLAPMLAPAAGVSVASVVGGELFGGAFNAGAEYLQSGKVTPQNVLEGALYGGIFAGASGKIVSTVGQNIGGNIGRVMTGGGRVLVSSEVPLSAKVAGVGIETGLNAGLGAGANAGIEYSKTGQVTAENLALGAGFGAAFTLGGRLVSGINSKYDVSGRIRTNTVENVQNFAIRRNLSNLEQIDAKYQQAFSAGERYVPTTRESLIMRATGVRPIKPNPQTLELPTVATSKVPDVEASDMGIKITSRNTEIIHPSARAANAFEGDILLNRAEVIKIKTGIAAEMADTATTMYGRSMAPEDFYAKDLSFTETPKQKAPPTKPVSANQNALTDQRITQTPIKVSAKDNFVTNRIVDDYLTEIGIKPNEPQRIIRNEPFEYTRKIEEPAFSAKQNPFETETQLQPELQKATASSEKPYMDPAKFEDAERLLNNQRYSKEELAAITRELNADGVNSEFSRQLTVPERMVYDIFQGRNIVDTSRPTGSFVKPFTASSFSPKPTITSNTVPSMNTQTIPAKKQDLTPNAFQIKKPSPTQERTPTFMSQENINPLKNNYYSTAINEPDTKINPAPNPMPSMFSETPPLPSPEPYSTPVKPVPRSSEFFEEALIGNKPPATTNAFLGSGRAMERNVGALNNSFFRGIYSVKRVYPIKKPEDFWG